MNCRRFERLTADWLSRRLPPDRAAAMDVHWASCLACAQVARAEEALREHWRAGTEPAPDADLWPRLARCLETPPPRVSTLGVPRWPQWAIAVCLAAGLALGIGIERLGNRAGFGVKASPLIVREAELQSHAAAWSALGAAGPEDPAVDDPTGATMETLWTSLKTDSK